MSPVRHHFTERDAVTTHQAIALKRLKDKHGESAFERQSDGSILAMGLRDGMVVEARRVARDGSEVKT